MPADPPWQTIPEMVLSTADRFGDAEAIVDGDLRITFAELTDKIRTAAGAFKQAGLDKGDRVAIWAPNSAEWIIAAFGLLTAGGVLVPVNTRFKAAEAGDIIRRSQAKLLLVRKNFLGLDFDFFLGVDVAVDFAAHHDGLGADVAVDNGGIAESQHAVRMDFAVQLAFKSELAGKLEVALDFNIRGQDVFRRVGVVHNRIHNFMYFLSDTLFAAGSISHTPANDFTWHVVPMMQVACQPGHCGQISG